MNAIKVLSHIFKISECHHYYFNGKRIKKRTFNARLERIRFIEEQSNKPYVTVTHKPTNRQFQLNMGYNLLSTVTPDSGNVSDWDGWNVTNPTQKPVWAKNLPDNEFYAIWHFKK